jgi:hypothetical protein
MTECNRVYLTDETLTSLSLVPSTKVETNFDITNSNDKENETFSQTETMKILRQRLEKLYNCIANDQIIHIYNLENIKLSNVTHSIKHKVDTLFFEAGIPQKWKIYIKWTISPVFIVHLRMLNYLVQEKTKELLTTYFSTNYHNNSI